MDQRDLIAIVEEEIASGLEAFSLAKRIETAQRDFDCQLLETLGYTDLANIVRNL